MAASSVSGARSIVSWSLSSWRLSASKVVAMFPNSSA